jgi:dUTP pyrophosphatase
MKVRIKKSNAEVTTPEYQTPGSAGCDVSSAEELWIKAGKTAMVRTGIFLEVPEGYECQCRPRSGLAARHGVTILNSPGTIDSDFRGEMKVLLLNVSDHDFFIEKGMRIAQFVFAAVKQAEFEVVDELSETNRGSGGWGSTGV